MEQFLYAIPIGTFFALVAGMMVFNDQYSLDLSLIHI